MKEADLETKKRKLTSAIDVLQSLFEKSGTPLSGQYVRWQLEQQWEEIVGKTVAQNSRPGNYIKGTLYLAVVHPAWIHQLKFMEEEIMRSVNSFVGSKWAIHIKYFVENKDSQ